MLVSNDRTLSVRPYDDYKTDKAALLEEEYFSTHHLKKGCKSSFDKKTINSAQQAFQMAEKSVGRRAASVRNEWKRTDWSIVDQMDYRVSIHVGNQLLPKQIAKLNDLFFRMVKPQLVKGMVITHSFQDEKLMFVVKLESPELKIGSVIPV